MEEGLAEINSVAGVRGSLLCDSWGEAVASAAPAGLDTATLKSVGHQVTQTAAGLRMTEGAMTELDFTYEGTRLVARDLANAVLVVLCEPKVDIAMLRMTMNVVTARLKSDGSVQKRLEARAAKDMTQDEADEMSWHLLKALTGRRRGGRR